MDRYALLQDYIEECRNKPFVWGSWDCCQFVSGWVTRVSGKDPRSAFVPYTDEVSARSLLKDAGGLVALTSSVLREIHPSAAHCGDLILSRDVEGAALGICLGVHSAHVGKDGLVFLGTSHGIKAWRVE